MITLYDLEFIEALVEHSSQTEASKMLGITKSAVSQRISTLEERIGVKIVNRAYGRLSLTPKGQLVLQSSTRILDELSALKKLLNKADDNDQLDENEVALMWFDDSKRGAAFKRPQHGKKV